MKEHSTESWRGEGEWINTSPEAWTEGCSVSLLSEQHSSWCCTHIKPSKRGLSPVCVCKCVCVVCVLCVPNGWPRWPSRCVGGTEPWQTATTGTDFKADTTDTQTHLEARHTQCFTLLAYEEWLPQPLTLFMRSSPQQRGHRLTCTATDWNTKWK